MIVTIDGPAGTGKSTVARQLAEALEFEYLDTGAMYRMVALQAVRENINLENPEAVTELAPQVTIDFRDGRALLDGVDVSEALRTSEVADAASQVAQNPNVRDVLVLRQRQLADNRDIVCEGRDQGTVVFPHAECKFFLTAAREVRAQRRLDELRGAGKDVTFDQLLQEQNERDKRDETRAIAPLKAADDAETVDTTNLSIEDVVAYLVKRVKRTQN